MKQTILCVDDEIDNVDALERLLRKKYTVLKATSGKSALEILAKNPDIALIISDQRMPEMTGVQFLETSLNSHPDTVRILLTGFTDIESIISAINSAQIYRYLSKPWDPSDLAHTVDRAVERFQMAKELKETNIQLTRALSELTKLDEAKSHFMILINHELKTPLTSLLSFLELLNESNLTDEQKLFVSRIQKSAFRLKEITTDVLKIVSAETGQLKTERTLVTLVNFLLPLPDFIEKEISAKNIKLKLNWQSPDINADPVLLREVLHRLLHNAVKFCSENSTIEVNSQDMNGKTELEVYNVGSSIPDHMIEKILKPFTINEDIMNHSKGLGLGLGVCQSLLKVQNSELSIQNTSEGVRVSFIL